MNSVISAAGHTSFLTTTPEYDTRKTTYFIDTFQIGYYFDSQSIFNFQSGSQSNGDLFLQSPETRSEDDPDSTLNGIVLYIINVNQFMNIYQRYPD